MGLKVLGMHVDLMTVEQTQDKCKNEYRVCCKNRKNSCLAWSAFWLLFLANLCMMTAYVSPGWAWTHEVGGMDLLQGEYFAFYGIWYSCWTHIKDTTWMQTGRTVCQYMSRLDNVPEWWATLQALATITIIIQLAAYIVLCVYMCIPHFNSNTKVMMVHIALVLIALLFAIPCFVTFVILFTRWARWCCNSTVHLQVVSWEMYYSFMLCCISCGLMIASVIASIYDVAAIEKHRKREALLDVLYQEGKLGDRELASIRSGEAELIMDSNTYKYPLLFAAAAQHPIPR